MEALKELLIKISRVNVAKLSDNEVLNLLISITSLAIATLSLAIALIVLFYAAYQFILKRGSRFYGAFSISSSLWSNQRYVGQVILENTKDKAVAISTIYLRIGKNIYVELIDYCESPKIIAPFETIKFNFREGVSGYISSTYKVNLDSLLANKKARKTLIIATAQGLTKVKEYKTIWNIYIESLKNYFVVPVHPVKKHYKGEYHSDALQFIITNTSNEGKIEEYHLYRDATYNIGGVAINTNDFSDSAELKLFLIASRTHLNSLEVVRAEYSYNDYESYEDREINYHGFFGTYVAGALLTKLHRLHFRMKNRKKQ
ncbi:hypothetical protein [Pseudomonas viridiflava]|uniref:hypothetical protein n=1 Tax=Pseudomonas viridiflava TaxID=33069 RepID=UPI000F01793A|nr:hypothetical protein [Pseudomonas viridiflava]